MLPAGVTPLQAVLFAIVALFGLSMLDEWSRKRPLRRYGKNMALADAIHESLCREFGTQFIVTGPVRKYDPEFFTVSSRIAICRVGHEEVFFRISAGADHNGAELLMEFDSEGHDLPVELIEVARQEYRIPRQYRLIDIETFPVERLTVEMVVAIQRFNMLYHEYERDPHVALERFKADTNRQPQPS